MSAPERGVFHASEKRRLVVLLALFVTVGVAFVAMVMKVGIPRETGPSQAPPTAAPIAVQVATPPIRADEYRKLARDATREERVLIETAALRTALEDARLLTDAHFEPLGGVELDAPRCEELRAAPGPARGRLFRIRGWIEEVAPFETTDSTPQHFRGRVRLEDGARADFAVHDFTDLVPAPEEFVRFDGLFLKLHATSTPTGWNDAPLFVGGRGQRSFPSLGAVASLDPLDFMDVLDDGLDTGFVPVPFDEYWKLVAYARDVDPSTIDWARAPLLDRDRMAEIVAGGESLRAVPLRFPPCRVQDVWRQAQIENPARIAYLTEGWLGAWDWAKVSNGVVRFVSPQEIPIIPGDDGAPGRKLGQTDEIVARGFYFRKFAYEPAKGGIEVAPLVVLQSFEPYTPPKDTTWPVILAVVGTSFALIVIALFVILVRDRKKAEALQAELLRRRRARRAQAQSP